MPTRPSVRHNTAQLLVIFFGLTLFAGTCGYLYYNHQSKQVTTEKQNELSAIAELKVNEISRWLKERMRDGQVIGGNPLIGRTVQQWLHYPDAGGLKAQIQSWIESFRNNFDYRAVLLADSGGKVYLSSPVGKEINPEIRKHFVEVYQTKEPLFIDLYRSSTDQEINCALLVPVLAEEGRTTVGVLVLLIDPEEFLYPLIQSWPTPSHTAETLLVRKEGNEVVFLNELRHRKNTALLLRLPLDENQTLAATQAFTQEGVVEAVDYRGIPILAALKAVPDSPWFLVAKVDMDEIFAPIRERAWLTGLLVALLIAAGGMIAAAFWNQQKIKSYRREYELELEKLELSKKYQYLTRFANDSIMLADISGAILEVNERATATYGYTRDEFLRLNIRDIRAPESVAELEKQWQRVKEQNGLVFETMHRRKDGTTFPVEISVRIIQLGGAEHYWGTIRDISERKRSDEILRQSEQRYRTLFEDSPISMWETDYTAVKLFIDELSAKGITDFRAYFDEHPEAIRHAASLVKIIDVNNATLKIYQTESKAELQKDLAKIFSKESYDVFKQVLIDLAERKVGFEAEDVTQTFKGEKRFISLRGTVAPGCESTLSRIFVSLVDITTSKQAEEALRQAHDELETRVAERTGELRSLNIQLKQEIQEREMAQKAAADQARILEAFFKHSTTPLVFLTRDFDFIRVNDAYAKTCRRNAEDFVGRNHFELYPSEAKTLFEQVVTTKRPYEVLARPFMFPDRPELGITYWDWTLVPLFDGQGEVEYLVFSLNDVTERKRAEEALQKSEEKYRELVENANSIIMKVDAQGNITFFNEFAQQFFGFSEREILGKHVIGSIIPERDSTGKDLTEMVRDFTDHPEKYTTNENENMRSDGERVWVSWTNKILKDEEGGISGLLCIGIDISDRKRAEQAVRESEKQLRFLSSKLLTAQEEERKRISRELHDSIGSSLSAIKFGVENYLKLGRPDRECAEWLKGITSMAQQTIDEVRRIMSDLRPAMLDDLGLVTTLGWFFRQFENIHPKICVEDKIEIEEDEIAEDLKIVIFRVIQEAFNNISKYSRAELVNFSLKKDINAVALTIEDSGDGFDVNAALYENNSHKGLGLTSMRERGELSGGTFRIESSPGEGTIIQASWRHIPGDSTSSPV